MFYIIDQGSRIQTPLESLLRAQTVNALEETGPIATIGTDQAVRPQTQSSKTISEEYRQTQGNSSQKREPALFAEQIMTHPVVAIKTNESFFGTWGIFEKHRFHHLPVIDDNKKLCGIVTDRDLMRFTINNQQNIDIAPLSVDQVMTHKVISAAVNTEIRSIADVMCRQGFSAMPITDEQRHIIGMVSRTDILRTFVNQEKLEMWV